MSTDPLTITDRLLLGEKVAVIGPNLRRSFDFLGDIAEELADAGHNYRITRERLSLDNGGALEAVTLLGLRGRTLDHVVILGAVDDHDVLPAVTPGGTISRR